MIRNLVVSTKSAFREYIFKNNLGLNDLVVYENGKDFKVNYETDYLNEEILSIINKNFNSNYSPCFYKYVENINSPEFTLMLENIGEFSRFIMTGANFLREKQYYEVSKRSKTILNIHIGDPNKFRGLDSNYWSLLENKKSKPVVTLHHANLKLDTGEILFQVESDFTFEELTLEKLIKFEIEAVKKCMNIAFSINEKTPIDSVYKNVGIYRSAMSAEEKKEAFKSLRQK